MRRIFNLSFVFLSLFLVSCQDFYNKEEKTCTITPATKEIKTRTFEFAKLYSESETEYQWGGQSPLRAIKIDCSGLVVMCYKYALADTKYSLIENDMSSSYMYEHATYLTDTPDHGDLIFMGEIGTDKITHIAIYDREENGEIYFIDATNNESVNGVSERHYEKVSEKFKAFGIMKLKY